jgi:hypothetical protein
MSHIQQYVVKDRQVTNGKKICTHHMYTIILKIYICFLLLQKIVISYQTVLLLGRYVQLCR